MNQYSYDGPIMMFGICIDNNWKGSTYAASERKAKSNLAYRYKTENNMVPSTKITLPGQIAMVR